MNWKINYWTLLFALAAVSAAYQWTSAGQASSKMERLIVNCPAGQQFNISENVAQNRIARYHNNYAPKVRSFAADSCNTLNGGVEFFGIKACELQAMVDTFQTADSIIAVMCAKAGSAGAKDTLDLIFQVYTTYGPVVQSKYYDFTNPCPPCSEN